MNQHLAPPELERLRDSVGDSFNIFQATVAMVAIFIGFVFSGLLQILLSSDPLTEAMVLVLWLLTLAMATLSFSLILFHATAHRVLRYWRIFYPVSIFNKVGAMSFNMGLLLMFLSIAALFLQKELRTLSILTAGSGLAIVIFGLYFRRMHTGGPHIIDVDQPSPNFGMPPPGGADASARRDPSRG
jgi:hypothetical protein